MTVAQVTSRKWSRREYDRLVDVGILRPDECLELIDGEILEKGPQGSRHAAVVSLVQKALHAAVGPGQSIRSQLPLALGDDSEPEPDCAVIEGEIRDFLDHHPQAALLVVEVSGSSSPIDRGRKLALYARHGVPEYWIVDLTAVRVIVHRDPAQDGYAERTVLAAGDEIRSPALARPVAVSDLLP